MSKRVKDEFSGAIITVENHRMILNVEIMKILKQLSVKMWLCLNAFIFLNYIFLKIIRAHNLVVRAGDGTVLNPKHIHLLSDML